MLTPGCGSARELVVGVLSDTHGYLYPRVKALLQGVDHIIHAGDVGSLEVLAGLEAMAPLTVVRCNCDFEAWASSLPGQAQVEVGGVRILVRHVAFPRAEGGYDVVIAGHSHLAVLEWRGEILHLNPGSAGPQRFGRPRTVARLTIRPCSECEPGVAGHQAHAPRDRVRAEILNAEDLPG